jgi:hypothetical protein
MHKRQITVAVVLGIVSPLTNVRYWHLADIGLCAARHHR